MSKTAVIVCVYSIDIDEHSTFILKVGASGKRSIQEYNQRIR
jgi:hypothetical protein